MELKIKIFFLAAVLILPSKAFALECEWWQVKVRTHKVDSHKREGVGISSHQRKEHVHKAAHYHFSELTESKKDQFLILSGWEKVIKNGKLQLLPPKELIKEDSKISPEEDFSNYVETFHESPERLKIRNLKLFQYFEERYSR